MLSGRNVVRGTVAITTVLLAVALASSPVVGQGASGDGGAVWLTSPRAGHSATLLPDGHVLIAGGSDGETELASVEVIDPIALSSETIGSMASARSGHSATLLADGRILLAGGESGGAGLTSAELLDPVGGGSDLTGPLQWARAGHTATLLSDGRVLLAGGVEGGKPVGRAEVFDPDSGTFDEVAKLKSAHLGPAAALLPDGRVLVTGAATKKKAKPAERYDPAKDKWSQVKGAAKRMDHTSTLLADGRLLQAGGSDGKASIPGAELYDPAAGAFVAAGELNAPRSSHTATPLPDGRVLILGGANAGFGIATIEVFDPTSGSFAIAGEVDLPPTGHTATLLPDGRVLLVGGRFVDLVLDDILVYDATTETPVLLGRAVLDLPDLLAEDVDPRTRSEIREGHGAPDAFAIYYFDEVLADGSTVASSMSQWSYYNEGVEYTFADERLVAEDAIELRGEARAEPVPYDPDQFRAYMSLDDVVAAAGLEEYVGGPVDEMVEGGDLYFADRLTWGVKDGELRYIEALALEAEAPSPEDE